MVLMRRAEPKVRQVNVHLTAEEYRTLIELRIMMDSVSAATAFKVLVQREHRRRYKQLGEEEQRKLRDDADTYIAAGG